MYSSKKANEATEGNAEVRIRRSEETSAILKHNLQLVRLLTYENKLGDTTSRTFIYLMAFLTTAVDPQEFRSCVKYTYSEVLDDVFSFKRVFSLIFYQSSWMCIILIYNMMLYYVIT